MVGGGRKAIARRKQMRYSKRMFRLNSSEKLTVALAALVAFVWIVKSVPADGPTAPAWPVTQADRDLFYSMDLSPYPAFGEEDKEP